MTLIARIAKRLRQTLYPTESDRILQKWRDQGGDEQFRFDYPLDENSLVLDCGGYRGQWASDLFSRYCCRIVVFEPVDSFAELIKKRFIGNGKIEVHQCGLGGHSRSETIRLSEDGSSIFRSSGQQQEMKIIDAKDWFATADMNGQTIQLMKINIEGGEYELLERLIELRLIENIENIQVQFHDFFPTAASRMAGIQSELAKTHHLTYHYRFVWENWRKTASGRQGERPNGPAPSGYATVE